MIAVERLPVEIRESRRAVVWRYEMVPGREKPTKVPYQARRPDLCAKSTDPRTWGTFAEALRVVRAGRADGVGFVLGDGIAGVDLDDCRDPETGVIASDALEIVGGLSSYSERSPGTKLSPGTGLHVLLHVHGTLPPVGRQTGHEWRMGEFERRQGKIEMYTWGRYFTVTGAHLAGTPTTIEERTPAFAAPHARIFAAKGTRPGDSSPSQPRRPFTVDLDDARVIARVCGVPKYAALWRGDWRSLGYPSQSEADLALCSKLAYCTGGDAARIDRLFRQSGLMRPKWNREDYREGTIAMAVAGCRRIA